MNGMSKPLTCPVCDKEIIDSTPAAKTRLPFCSSRCRQVDFYRWCTGKYAIVEPLSDTELQQALLRQQEFGM